MSIPVLARLAFAVSAVAVFATAGFAETSGASDEAMGMSDIGDTEEYTLYPIPGARDGGPRPTPFAVNARGEYQFDAGIDNAGDFSVVRAMGGVGFAFPIGDKFGVALGAALNYSGYDFDRSPAFGGGEPWEDIYSTIFTAISQYTINDEWTVFGGGVFAFSGEEGVDFSDSFVGGGVLGAGYRMSNDLIVRVGVSVLSELEDDVSILPVLLVDWRIDERWRFRVGSLDTGAADMVGAGLTYKISDQWSLGGRVSYADSRFRLDDSGFAPDGVGQDERYKATLVLSWHPQQNLELSVLGGMVFGGELRVEDEDGVRLFKEDYDSTPFVGARFVWRF